MTAVRCISPVDGAVFVERPLMDFAEASAVVAAGRAAQPEWAARPLSERVEIVRRGCDTLCAEADEATPELAWMMGRPVRYGGEFGGVLERVSYMADIAAEALRPVAAEESDAFIRRIEREPQGAVFVVAPWNYPYLTAVNTAAPALIAGNAVFLKPSAQTPLAGERFARAFIRAGVPAKILRCMFLNHETALRLISAGVFDFINFTGSVEGGRAVERAAAGTF
ncbi:MAG: aldehyde dehydrogenase family protein, partial [Betaproteobacteria bacterium]|nr:aldehyde dehydrogenase family protein [Betaproteobacteria bacterium]